MKLQAKNKYLSLFSIGWLGIFLGIFAFGWRSTWNFLLIPVKFPSFSDMRTVQGSLSSIESGFNPQVYNPGDIWERKMNYPTLWSEIAHFFSLDNEINFTLFMFFSVICFLICCASLLKKFPSAVMLIFLFSGSTLLLVERGNNDLIIFSLLYISILKLNFFSVPLFLLAVSLKIFPVLSIVAFYEKRKILLMQLIGIFPVLFYLLPELSFIREGTPISAYVSFGSLSLSALAPRLGIEVSHILISCALFLSSLVLLIASPETFKRNLKNYTQREKLFFLTGSSIFLGSFVLSSNWDYRLIFLVLCIPFLTRIVDAKIKITIFSLLIISSNQLLLHAVFGAPGAAINIISKTILFVLLSAIFLYLFWQINLYKNLPLLEKNVRS